MKQFLIYTEANHLSTEYKNSNINLNNKGNEKLSEVGKFSTLKLDYKYHKESKENTDSEIVFLIQNVLSRTLQNIGSPTGILLYFNWIVVCSSFSPCIKEVRT